MMKLLAIYPGYEPAWAFGGVAHSGSRQCRALAAEGVEVVVYATNLDGAGGTLDIAVNQPVERGGVSVWYFPAWLDRVFYSPALIERLQQTVREFDLVYIAAAWQWIGIEAARLARRAGVKYVAAPRGSLHPATLAERPMRKWLYRKLFLNDCLRQAAAIHYTTDYEQRLAERTLGPHRSFVVANPLDQRLFDIDEAGQESLRAAARRRWGLTDEMPVLLTVMRPDPVKRLDVLLEALRDVLEQWGQVNLVVVGDDQKEYFKKMKQMAWELGVASDVIWAGRRFGDELLEDYFGADMFVLTSAHENFSNVTAEAMALGLPVVVTGRCGIARDVRRNQMGKVTSLDSQAAARAIMMILDDPDYYEQLSAQAEESAYALYRPEEIANQMIDEFAKLIGHE